MILVTFTIIFVHLTPFSPVTLQQRKVEKWTERGVGGEEEKGDGEGEGEGENFG